MAARLPIPGQDNGAWGDLLNEYLTVSHNPDGTIASDAIGPSQIPASSIPASKLDSATQSSLSKADTALQVAPVTSVNGLTGVVNVPAATDAIVADFVTTGPLTSAAIATVASPIKQRTLLGARTVFDGDSITIGGVSSNAATGPNLQDRATGWPQVMMRASNGRIEELFNAGLAGQTSNGALSRFDTYVAPYAPQTVILTIGTNDIGQSVPQATWQANLLAYWDKCKAINATLVLGEIFPTNDSSMPTRGSLTRSWNLWLHEWARTNDIPIIPWSELADITTGGWPAAWTVDAIHPLTRNIATTTIGQFGWDAVKDLYGQPVVKRATMIGADLLTNGFFTILDAAIGVPTVTTPTTSTASGTLAAGTYSYKVSARSYSGNGTPSTAVSGTLGSTGTITFTWNNVSQNKGFAVYRKAPGDSNWYLLQNLPSLTVTFSDNGSYTESTVIPTVDDSRRPTGMSIGSTQIHAAGFNYRTVTGIRGNVWRFTPWEGGTESQEFYTTGAIAAGDVIEISGLAAGDGVNAVKLLFYFRNSSTNLVGIRIFEDVLTTSFTTFHHRLTAPATTVGGRVYFYGPIGGYVDVAELRVEKVA